MLAQFLAQYFGRIFAKRPWGYNMACSLAQPRLYCNDIPPPSPTLPHPLPLPSPIPSPIYPLPPPPSPTLPHHRMRNHFEMMAGQPFLATVFRINCLQNNMKYSLVHYGFYCCEKDSEYYINLTHRAGHMRYFPNAFASTPHIFVSNASRYGSSALRVIKKYPINLL